MKCLIQTSWDEERKFVVKQGAKPITLVYNDGYAEEFYWIDLDTIEDLVEFLGNYDGYRMFHQDGRDMVNGSHLDVKEWPEELKPPFVGLYLDYMGW